MMRQKVRGFLAYGNGLKYKIVSMERVADGTGDDDTEKVCATVAHGADGTGRCTLWMLQSDIRLVPAGTKVS